MPGILTPKPDELRLLDLARKGNPGAQKTIYDKLAPKMLALCLRYMGDRMAAEDILQDGFVTLFSKLGSFSGLGSFEGWARRIFVNTALMALRRSDVLKDSDDMDCARNVVGESSSAIQELGYKELMRLVSGLPPGFRTVFNLYVVEGYSHKEISDMLGISENTSRSQLQRARLLLQQKIKELTDGKGH